MRLNPACQNVVPVDDQMVRGDRGGEVFMCITHIVHRVLRGHMFHDDLEVGHFFAQRFHDLVDEDGFAVEDVDITVGDFAVHAKGHADVGHFFQNWADFVKVCHAGGRIGGCTSRVEFDRSCNPVGMGVGQP